MMAFPRRRELRTVLPVLASLALHGAAVAASLAWMSPSVLSPPGTISVALVMAGEENAGVFSSAAPSMPREPDSMARDELALSPEMPVAQSAEATLPPPPPAKPKSTAKRARSFVERVAEAAGPPAAEPPTAAPAAPPAPSTANADPSASLAGSSQRADLSSIDADYLARILALLSRQKRYPDEARERQEQGTVVVALAINRAGDVLAVDVRKRSGSVALDDEAQTMVRRAAPLPPVPTTYSGTHLTLLFPVIFALH